MLVAVRIVAVVAMGLVGTDYLIGRELAEVERVFRVASGLTNATLLPVLVTGWFPAMQTASCLCRDSDRGREGSTAGAGCSGG